MYSYTVFISKKAQKQLDKLSDNVVEPILKAISSLENNPKPIGCKKSYKGARVIYEIFDTELVVDVVA